MSNDIENGNDATPDALMSQFKGRGLKQVLIVTVVVHIVVIIGSSVPFFVRSVMAGDSSKLSEEERVSNAVEDASAALRKIAKKHGLNPQDISSQFAGGGSRTAKSGAAKAPAAEPNDANASDGADGSASDDKSAYETNLEAKAVGPATPTFEDDEDDIF